MHNAIQRDPVSRKSQEEQGNYNETPWDGGGFHGLATDHLDDVDFINIQPVIKASTVEDREEGGGWSGGGQGYLNPEKKKKRSGKRCIKAVQARRCRGWGRY